MNFKDNQLKLTICCIILILMFLLPYIEKKYFSNINNEVDMSTMNYHIEDFKIVPHTVLTEEELKIQEDQGCIPCHNR